MLDEPRHPFDLPMPPGSISDEVEARLQAFLRGALKGAELKAFERELDADPALLARIPRGFNDSPTAAAEGPTLGAGTPRAQHAPEKARLALGGSIGRGGMARILAATQPALGRSVAVKMAQPGAEPWVNDQLLQEARLTGSLEHPGIVPVHDLLTDENGQVQVVLKRIEGEPWSALINNADAVRTRFGLDPLEWNVSVAINVCRAMGFAHQRGVIHRDIKPGNVMVGQFGEVYLLDWGVAGTLVADPSGLLPCVAEVPFAGTLNFMAPEQVLSQVSHLGPWTDTYLLGACLYAALYGAAPHEGMSLDARCTAAAQPVVCAETQWLARELVAIVRKALQPEPRERYLTADELRADLEAFLRHRDRRRPTERATAQVLLARVARERGDFAMAERSAAEAEFGCRAALELWPEDRMARRLLEDLGAERVSAALETGDTQVAARLLGGLASPPDGLREKVAAAVSAEAATREGLARIVRDADRFVGLSVKRWLLAVFGLAWLAFWWAMAFWPPASALPVLGFFAVWGTAGTLTVLRLRKLLLEQRLNREMLLVQLAMICASMALAVVGHTWGLPVPQVLGLMMLVWSLAMAALAAIIEPASLVPAIAWMVAFLVSAVWPPALRPCLFAGTLVHVVGPLIVSLRLRRASVAG